MCTLSGTKIQKECKKNLNWHLYMYHIYISVLCLLEPYYFFSYLMKMAGKLNLTPFPGQSC